MVSRLAAALVACVLVFSPLCATVAQPSGAGTLRSIARQYYAWHFQTSPLSATRVGVHDYDAEIGSYGAADFANRNRHMHRTLAALQAIPSSTLSLDDQADQVILENSIKEALWHDETQREWTTDPGQYTAIASDAVYSIMSRNYAPPAQRLRYVIAREQKIPAMLAQGEGNLLPAHVAPVTAKLAALDTAGAVDFFTKDVPDAFAGVKDPALRAQFSSANAAAIAALKRYLAFVQSSIVPRAHGSYAIGPVNYAYLERLQNVTAIPLARLLNVGESALASDRAAFIAAAKRIDPTRSPQAVYASLGAQHPAADRILRTAQNVLTSLVAFIKAHGIIDLPSAPIAKVIATPKFQAQTSFASMDSPGPLEARATEAYYRVTVPDPSWSSRQVHEQLAFLNDYALPIISLHEVYPGHYTNYLFNKQAHLSLIRKLNWNPAFGEGWAHYDEQMMVDAGLGNGDPRYRLAQLALALQRECRYIVGIEEHTQGMSVAGATTFFMDNAFMARAPAYREALRGTQDPLYGYYTLGRLMLLKLRADDRARLGAAFTLRTFHDALLSHGDPPIYFLRKMILGAGDTGSLL